MIPNSVVYLINHPGVVFFFKCWHPTLRGRKPYTTPTCPYLITLEQVPFLVWFLGSGAGGHTVGCPASASTRWVYKEEEGEDEQDDGVISF